MYSRGSNALNPENWSREQVRVWLEWTSSQYNLQAFDTVRLGYMDGRDLCRLTREEFIGLLGSSTGDLFYSHLKYLRSQFNSRHGESILSI